MRVTTSFRRHGAWALAAGLVIGHFAPWAAHKSAALTLNANELAVFTNATPHAGVFFNEGFLLPLWGAALLIMSSPLPASHWVRLALAGVITLLALPGFVELRAIAACQPSPFVWQLVISIGVGALCAWAALCAPRWLPVAATVPAALAAWTALIGFAIIRNSAIASLYKDSVGFGSGWWLTVCCAVGLTALAFVTILRTSPPHR
jgi:hypothetical protein